MAELTIQELKDKISNLDRAGETELANKYRAELSRKEGGKSGTPIAGDIVLAISPDDFEKAGSKFAAPGLHKSSFGMPYWKTTGTSLSFPFTVIEGADINKEGEIFCGISKDAAWKIKEILAALNVSYKTVNGMVSFNPSEVAGKTGMTLWVQQKDRRSVEEGGKGTIYTKASGVYPVGSTLESIGMPMKSLLIQELV